MLKLAVLERFSQTRKTHMSYGKWQVSRHPLWKLYLYIVFNVFFSWYACLGSDHSRSSEWRHPHADRSHWLLISGQYLPPKTRHLLLREKRRRTGYFKNKWVDTSSAQQHATREDCNYIIWHLKLYFNCSLFLFVWK